MNLMEFRKKVMRSKHELILSSQSDVIADKLLELDTSPDYIPSKTRLHLIAMANNRCNICKMVYSDDFLQIDHIQPLARGGTAHLRNLQVLCRTCNLQKGCNPVDPASYKKGYVIPIHVLTDRQIYAIILDKVDDPNT